MNEEPESTLTVEFLRKPEAAMEVFQFKQKLQPNWNCAYHPLVIMVLCQLDMLDVTIPIKMNTNNTG